MNRPVIYAPMWMEARRLRRGLNAMRPGTPPVVRFGMGAQHARTAADRARTQRRPAAVAGLCRGLREDLRPGDIIVADKVYADPLTPGPTPVRLPAAELLASDLRRRGLPVHVGALVGVRRLVGAGQAQRLAALGALGADQESAWLLAGCQGVPLACVRVVADAEGDAILRPRMLGRLLTGLRVLPHVASALHNWSAATSVARIVRTATAAADIVLVLGSADSRTKAVAYAVNDVSDVDLRWLAGVRTVGLAVGASAPPRLADRLVAALGGLGARQVDEHGPKEVQR